MKMKKLLNKISGFDKEKSISIKKSTKADSYLKMEDLIKDESKEKVIFINENLNVKIVDIIIGNVNTKSETKFIVGKNSSLHYLCISDLEENSLFNKNDESFLDIGSTMHYKSLNLGGVNDIKYIANCGEKTNSNISNVFLGQKSDDFKVIVENNILEREVKGKILIKSVLKDGAKGNIEGRIKITKNGALADTYLKEDVLLLDNQSSVKAIPLLAIDTNDVKAGHGVSVTKLDLEELFYMMSRGLDEKEAKKMIVEGFLIDLFEEEIDDLTIGRYILEGVRKRFS